MAQFESKMVKCKHDFVGTAQQPVRLFCNNCGLSKLMADYVEGLRQRLDKLEDAVSAYVSVRNSTHRQSQEAEAFRKLRAATEPEPDDLDYLITDARREPDNPFDNPPRGE